MRNFIKRIAKDVGGLALGAALGAAALFGMGASEAKAAELLMFEEPGCVYCAQWRREIGPIYPRSREGQIAPIRFLQKQYPNVLEDKYQADASDAVELLNQIAKARACLSKGGELDLAKASRLLIDDFRNGKLGKITLELPPECPSGNTNVEQTCDEKVK